MSRPRFHRIIEIEGSNWIKAIQYDPETWTLDATLKTGERYRYNDVFSTAFARLVTSKSTGKAFNALVKHLPYTKLPKSRK